MPQICELNVLLRILPFVTFLKVVMLLKKPTPLVLSVVNHHKVLVHSNVCRRGTPWSWISLLNATVTRLMMKILCQLYMVTVRYIGSSSLSFHTTHTVK